MADQPTPSTTPEQGLRLLEQEMLDILGTFETALKKLSISGVMIQNTPGALDLPTPTVTIVMNPGEDGKKEAKRFQGPTLMSALRDAGMVLHSQIVAWGQTTNDFDEYFAQRVLAQKLREAKPIIYIPGRN